MGTKEEPYIAIVVPVHSCHHALPVHVTSNALHAHSQHLTLCGLCTFDFCCECCNCVQQASSCSSAKLDSHVYFMFRSLTTKLTSPPIIDGHLYHDHIWRVLKHFPGVGGCLSRVCDHVEGLKLRDSLRNIGIGPPGGGPALSPEVLRVLRLWPAHPATLVRLKLTCTSKCIFQHEAGLDIAYGCRMAFAT